MAMVGRTSSLPVPDRAGVDFHGLGRGGDTRFDGLPAGASEVLGLFFDDFPDVEDLGEIMGWLGEEGREGIRREEVNNAALTLDYEHQVATFEDLLYDGDDVVMPFAELAELCRRWIGNGGQPGAEGVDRSRGQG